MTTIEPDPDIPDPVKSLSRRFLRQYEDAKEDIASLAVLGVVPSRGLCHPAAADVEEKMQEWARRHGLVPTERHLARLQRARYAWLMARCHPHADQRMLQILADFIAWFFIFDDAHFDRVHPEPRRVITAISSVLGVLESGEVSRTSVFGEAAIADLCRRLRRQTSDEQYERFAQAMRLYVCSVAVQVLGHLNGQSVTMTEYETTRRYVSGVEVGQALTETSNPGAVPAEEYYRGDVRSVSRRMNNIVSWLNDLHSLAVESYQPGYFWNMPILYCLQGSSIQDGVDATLRKVRAEVEEFEREAAEIEPKASRELRDYIDGMRQWMSGYCEWVAHDSQRYSPTHAPHDGDDNLRKDP